MRTANRGNASHDKTHAQNETQDEPQSRSWRLNRLEDRPPQPTKKNQPKQNATKSGQRQ
jgi:hypothetical protein